MTERSRLKKRISGLFRASLGSSCSIYSRKLSESVQEPIFVSRWNDFQKLDRSLSFPSFPEDYSSLQVPPPRLSVDCGGCRPTSSNAKRKQRRKEEKRLPPGIGVSFEKGGNEVGDICPPASPISPSNYCFKQVKEEMQRLEIRIKKTMRQKNRKKLLSNSYGFTSSSSGESDENGFFSSDEGKKGVLEERELETETLFSSKSFSSDSSEFYCHPTLHRKKSSRQKKPRRGGAGDLSNRTFNKRYAPVFDGCLPAVAISSALAAPTEEEIKEKRNEGFAVVKESSDPYGDFRSSMVEMIVEKQMFGSKDLERLLHCYLSLNSPRHHWIIVEVFSEIWETFFGN